jgi:hypothetical protein
MIFVYNSTGKVASISQQNLGSLLEHRLYLVRLTTRTTLLAAKSRRNGRLSDFHYPT